MAAEHSTTAVGQNHLGANVTCDVRPHRADSKEAAVAMTQDNKPVSTGAWHQPVRRSSEAAHSSCVPASAHMVLAASERYDAPQAGRSVQ